MDKDEYITLRDPLNLGQYVRNWVKDKDSCIVMIDEIQKVYSLVNPALTEGRHVLATKKDTEIISFVDIILGLAGEKNIDLYVTGSNSKMLSSDIITEFRDKATNISLQPLSLVELFENNPQVYFQDLLDDYLVYGGMPLCVLKEQEEDKKYYLSSLFETTYYQDILEHNKFKNNETLNEILNIISDNCGSLINSQKIANIYLSKKKEKIDRETIQKYIKAFKDAYLITEVKRYDIKGNEEIGALKKYYFTDIGLRNAKTNFAFNDKGHLFENLIYNELIRQGYTVNIGSLNVYAKDVNNKTIRKDYEIDFKANKGLKRLYIQVCDDYNENNTERETKAYHYIDDQYTKIIIVNKNIKECFDKNGYTIIGIKDFLLQYLE